MLFLVRLSLSRLFRNSIATGITVLLVALVAGVGFLAQYSVSVSDATEKAALAPLRTLGADVVVTKYPFSCEPETNLADTLDGIARSAGRVTLIRSREDSETVGKDFEGLGLPVQLVGSFSGEEVEKISQLQGVQRASVALLAVYDSYSETNQRIILPEQENKPASVTLDAQSEAELERLVQADTQYKALAAEQKALLDKSEAEQTNEDQARFEETVRLLGKRRAEIYHEQRPDVFDAPVQRAAQVITPSPPEISTETRIVAGVASDSTFVSKSDIIAGRYFDAEDMERNTAILRSDFAQGRGLKLGDRLTLVDRSYQVIGIVRPSLTQNAPEVYVPLARLQEQIEAEGIVNMLFITADSNAEINGVISEIRSLSPQISVSAVSELAESMPKLINGALQTMAQYGRLVACLLAAFTVAIVSVLSATSIARRSHEFATYTAIGWPRWRIVMAGVGEVVVKCAMGLLAGIGGGYLLAQWLVHAVPTGVANSEAATVFFTILAGQGSAAAGAPLVVAPPQPTLSAYLYAGAFVLLISICSGLVVALRMHRVDPAAILRKR